MFDWSRINCNTAIHCKTEQEACKFMDECDKHGIKWTTGAPIREPFDYSYDVYKSSTCFRVDHDVLWFGNVKFYVPAGNKILEFSDLCKPDLPRICYILGGEDNPLKIGERFKIKGYGPEAWINEKGLLIADVCAGNSIADSMVFEAINHPEKIIRQPQFSEDEKALMRLYVNAGKPIFKPDYFENRITAWDKDEVHGSGIPKGILPQITERFDAAAYLESLGDGK